MVTRGPQVPVAAVAAGLVATSIATRITSMDTIVRREWAIRYLQHILSTSHRAP